MHSGEPINKISDSSVDSFTEKDIRSYINQFGWLALFFSLITVLSNLFHGNYLSTLLVGGLLISYAVLLWLNKKYYRSYITFLVIIISCFFLTVIAFAEGLKTGGYLYFLPLFFSLPFFIKTNRKTNWKIFPLFSIPIVCFSIILLFCDDKSTWQTIPDAVYEKMFYTNTLTIMLLSAGFSYLSINLERKYAFALREEKHKTEAAAEARTKFLSNMGHELRTPLNGIIGASNLIQTAGSEEEQQKFQNIIKYCSNHMLGLVNDILDFNKIEKDKLELHPIQCNLKEILSQSLLPFYDRFEEKNLSLQLIIDERLDTPILADDVRLVQVINNMISNALKFTEKGYVKLEAKLEKKQQGNLHVLFSIKDTGIGIPQEMHGRIFDGFMQVFNESTRKYGGTGLGLTISHRLLQLMNSALELQSEEGNGSTFSFTIAFPLAKKLPVSNNEETNNEKGNPEGIRVLLVEDNLINQVIAKKILENYKSIVTTCENGQIALNALAQDDNYNIILMDLEMPVMDGYTALEEIKKLYPNLPVLAFTATLLDNKMFNDLINLGFKDYVPKPFQPLQLVTKIKKYAINQNLD